jgi:hypothetical protein
MRMGRKLWTGALIAVAMTVGSVANAAFIDDWTVAFGDSPNDFIGVNNTVALGGAMGGTTFVNESWNTSLGGNPVAAYSIGDFGANRRATLVYGQASATGVVSHLSVRGVPPFGPSLALTQGPGSNSVEPVTVTMSYDFDISGALTGANLNQWSAFAFSAQTQDPTAFDMVWTVTDDLGGTDTADLTITGNGDYQLSFLSFGGVDFGRVANITFSFSPPVGLNFDMSLQRVAVVPVPPAAGLILLGMVGMGLRRRFVRK